MYKYHQVHRVSKMFIIWFVMILSFSCQVFWFELLDEINSKFQGIYNWGFSDVYLSRTYSSNYSKDPFGDEMSNIVDRSNQLKIAWVQNVKKVLDAKWCSLSDKKIRWILYYYVTGFRMDLARDLKMEMWDYDSKKYELSQEDVNKYCREYYTCVETRTKAAREVFNDKNKDGKETGNRPLIYGDPKNIETNCKEFFQVTYEAGKYNEVIKQNALVSEMWADKYWNKTTDDSPYDIMEDMWILAKLLYQEAEDPITPVFYDIPAFSNSKYKLRKGKDYTDNGEKDFDDEENGGDTGENPDQPQLNWWKKSDWQIVLNNQPNPWNWGVLKESPVKPIVSSDFVMMDEYDNLVAWLDGLMLDNNSTFSNLCDNREESELELKNEKSDEKKGTVEPSRGIDEFSEKDYQELVDYMLNAVDEFGKLPDNIEKEIEKQTWNSDVIWEGWVTRLRERAEEVKKCSESCKWLRIDQKASCLVKCACGEISSADIDLFNPDKTPWLWPILMIRYCSVPAVDTKFSVWWKRIHSIEEWLKEIYGVVDKLSREWLLWKWTQQYEFLDSSTKQMNFADSFAFTIDVEFVNIANKMSKHSDQFEDKELKNDNDAAQIANGISNSTNNPSTKNAYRIIKDSDGENSDWNDVANVGMNNDTQRELDKKPVPFTDLFETALDELHTNVESYWNLRLNQQMELWKNAAWYIDSFSSSATFLNGRKSKCKN